MLLAGLKLSDLRIREENTFEYQRANGLIRFDEGMAALSHSS